MKQKVMKRLTAIILTITLLCQSIPLEAAATSGGITIVDRMEGDSAEEIVIQESEDAHLLLSSSEYEATISGKITDEEGNGISGVSVVVFDVSEGTCEFFANVTSGESGTWQMNEAWVGDSYRVNYYKAGYEMKTNDVDISNVSGNVTLETVVAVPLEIEGLVCKEEDYTYTTDTTAETASITGYTGSDTAIRLPGELGGYPVTSVGSNVFKGNTTIETVVFSERISTVKDYAFYGCTGLKEIILPNVLSSIYRLAFSGCSSLTQVVVPDRVATINEYAFQNCINLSVINFPLCWANAQNRIFQGCRNLKSITVPHGVIKIPNAAFEDSEYLEEVVLPETVTVLGDFAFENCPSIKKMNLPGKLTTISRMAFQSCTGLTELVLPDTVTTINEYAFNNCTNLSSINYPLNWTNAQNNIFKGCINLKKIEVPDGVLKIPNAAFEGASSLEEVVLPTDLQEIGEYAFKGCTGLTEMEIPESIKVIARFTFQNCTGLTGMEFPAKLTTINGYAFSGCTGLTEIVLPDTVTTINEYAFNNCSNLSKINFPMNWTTAQKGIFQGCSSLKSITVPEGVTKIPNSAFEDATYLEEVILPDTVMVIGDYAFENCPSIKEIDLPDYLTTIGRMAFQSCTGLRNVVLPDSVTAIGEYAFNNCTKLSSINYPMSWSSAANGIFQNCSSLTSITVPEGVTKIPTAAFEKANYLKYIGLPESLEQIGTYAFKNCTAITHFVVPEKVTAIEMQTFYGCTGLVQIWLGENITSIDNSAFTNCSELTIHGVAGSYAETFAAGKSIPFSTEPVAYDQVTLRGTVTDEEGNGIAGVNVTVYDVDGKEYIYKNITTDEDGSWSIMDAVKGHEYLVNYYKAGYSFSGNNMKLTASAGGTAYGTVIAEVINITGLICKEEDYTYTTDDVTETASITGYTGTDPAILLPAKLGGYPVTSLADNVFAGNTAIEIVVFSEHITSIGEGGFKNCTALKEVILPNVLTVIRRMAFQNCSGISEMELPDTVTEIYEYAFNSCSNLTSINYPMNWTTAQNRIFEGCSSLKSITVPKGVTKIPNAAFEDATYLKEVILPDTVTVIGDYAFENCPSIKEIDLPSNLTTISRMAFQSCTGLTEIVLPDTVTTINEYAFNNCSNLSSMNYPMNWTTAQKGIFQGCSSLKGITVPEGVTKIPNAAFEDATYLEEVILPDTVTVIGDYAFENCPSIKEIDLPDYLTTIGSMAFQGCTGLRNVVLPDSVTTIGEYTFNNCTKLSSINYPMSWNSAANGIFQNCSSLTSITVPEGVTKIPTAAFEKANYLKYIGLPESLEQIGTYAFKNCTAITHFVVPEKVTAIEMQTFYGCTGLVQIWLGENITSIDNSAFTNCSELTIHGVTGSYAETFAAGKSIPFSTEPVAYDQVTLSGTVTDEEGNGIAGVNVTVYDVDENEYIYKNITTDEDGSWSITDAVRGHEYLVNYYKAGYSFSGNNMKLTASAGGTVYGTVIAEVLNITGLICKEEDYTYTTDDVTETASITGYTGTDSAILLPAKLGGYPVTSLADNVFAGNTAIETVVFSEHVTSIGEGAFKNCTALKEVILPNVLTVIRRMAFQNCSGISEMELPDTVTEIYEYAFNNCSSLTSINYPMNWTTAQNRIFEGCSSLKSITVPEGVTKIPNAAFEDATYLEEVILPDTVTAIGDYAFENCPSIKEIDLPSNLTTISRMAFQSCTGLTEIVLPDTVTTINEYAFNNCSNLSSINYPTNWTTAQNGIFQGCSSLKSITVPEGVTKIPNAAFEDAQYLEKVILPDSVTVIGDYVFENCTAMKDIKLPSALITIGPKAFQSCTGLRSVVLPDTVTTIGDYAFNNCTKLSSINYPLNWTSAQPGIFQNCNNLTEITVPEGVTKLPNAAFEKANYLKRIYLPESLTSIGDYAFHNGTSLRIVSVPNGVNNIGRNAFSNCTELRVVSIPDGECKLGEYIFNNTPEMTLYCEHFSDVLIYAIKNAIPFVQTGSAANHPDNVLDFSETSYFGDGNAVAANGTMTINLSYKVAEDKSSFTTDKSIYIYLPTNTVLNEETLKLNDKLCTNYTYNESKHELTIPVTENAGKVKFSLNVVAQGDLHSYALFYRTVNGVKDYDLIGILDDSVNVLTLNAPEIVSGNTISVNGLAPASSLVTLYVNNKEQGKVYTSKAGNWKSEVTIPSPVDYYTYTVSASCTSDETEMYQTTDVMYRADETSMTGFTMYYNEHNEIKKCDLMNSDGTKPKVYFLPGTQFDFEVKFDHPEQIDTLYVTSTRNNEVKYLETVYDEAKGAFVTDGFFDENNKNYVPGILSVEYTKHLPEVYIQDEYDFSIFDEEIEGKTEGAVTYYEATATDLYAQIDLSKVDDELKKTYLDAMFSVYDKATDGDLVGWLGSFRDFDKMASYIVKDENGKTYYVTPDFSDPHTWAMLIRDATGSKIVKMIIKTSMNSAEDLDQLRSLTTISENLKTANCVATILLKQYQIEKDMDALREEVWSTSYATEEQRIEALRLVDELEKDQSMFMLLTTIIPILAATAPATAVMAAPAILFTGMLGIIGAMAPIFWQIRANNIKAGKFGVDFIIDPSGYVYDTVTNERLEGVKTTAYFIRYDESDDFWDNLPAEEEYGELWDASEYDQENPIYTNADGKYAWDVPEGWWRVKYEKDGYETTWSEWLPVPPPQTEVNIGMTPVKAEDIAEGWSGATQWTLSFDGTLTFYGNGNMKNYGYTGGQPWLKYADQIKTVVVQDGVAAVGSGAFMGLTALESVVLPEKGLTKIGEAAFYGCSSLKEIDIPDTVYTVFDYTFKGCTALEDVRLSKILIKVGQGAFENCTALDYVYIPGDTEIIGSWSFKGCTALTEVDMTWADATEIREGAFKNCSALTTVSFPASMTTFGDSAFYGIGAEIFTVPATIKEVGPWCFARAALKEITFEGNAPTIGEGAFNKIVLTAYYPMDNVTWTADIMQNYGGSVTWKAK